MGADDELWDKLLLRLRSCSQRRGVCVLDARLVCVDGRLVLYSEPQVTRFEPHNQSAMIEAILKRDGDLPLTE